MDANIIETLPKELRLPAGDIISKQLPAIEAYSRLCALFPQPLPLISILPSQLDLGLVAKYGIDTCRELSFLPISKCDLYLTAVSPTPWDQYKLSRIRALNYDSVRLVTVTDEAFRNLIDFAVKRISTQKDAQLGKTDLPKLNSYAWGREPAIRIVRKMFDNALKMGASDVHIEPQEDKVVVKFRINGTLVIQEPVHKNFKKAFIDAIKDLATLPLNETKNLADCRFSLALDGTHVVDFRVAKLPISGEYENFVFRLLDSEKILRNNGALPFKGKLLSDFESALNAESGMIILTGPTGSGKTTTLYSALMRLDLSGLNVRTIEDPIEYRIPKVVQTQIDTKNNVTFSRTLRSMLRADPDVIMVGEIRDAETAELAVGAANTGHLVLTTLHTRSAIGVIPRLMDLGLSKGDIQEAVTLVVSQRLLPKLCSSCKVPVRTSEAQKRHFEYYKITPPEFVYRELGCPDCNSTGIAGRVAVFEFLRFDSAMKDLMVSEKATLDAIAELNFKQYNPLVKEVLLQIAKGEVAYDEIRNYEPRMFEFLDA